MIVSFRGTSVIYFEDLKEINLYVGAEKSEALSLSEAMELKNFLADAIKDMQE